MGKKMEQRQYNMISGAGDLIGRNEDLIHMILIYIPHKPLTRFKSVSKLWLSVISDSNFSLRWNTKHAGSSSALLIRRSFDYKFISLDGQTEDWFGPNFALLSVPPFNYFRCEIEVLHRCNGLILFNLKVTPNLRLYEIIGVYNPRTNHSKLIPNFPQINNPNFTICYTNLVFDPEKSPHYKLVSFMLLTDPYPDKKIFIYSSETDSWKNLSPFFGFALNIIQYNYNLMFDAAVYLNGAIHWPSKSSRYSFYFHVDTERCVWMPMPPIQGGQHERTIRYFGESGGHLSLIDYKDEFTFQFDVFEMENDYSKWFVKYKVDLSPLSSSGSNSIKGFVMLSLFIKNGDKVKEEEESAVLMMYIPRDKMVISYNLKDRKSKNLCPLLLKWREVVDLITKKWSIVHQITY